MILSSISLLNFRSYAKKTFDFSPQTTLVIGPNTAGKTNLLEAIFFVVTGRSFRADQDREAIAWGRELARLHARISNFQFPISNVEKDETELEIVLTQGEVQGQQVPLKKYLVNGIPRRMVDFVGNLRAVLFWPEHLELVTDSPSIRRKYLDSVLVQIDREYRRSLASYERGIRQRNRLLALVSEGKAHRSQLLFWDQLCIKTGGYLTDARAAFIDFVNSYHVSLRPRSGRARITYHAEYDKSVISESRLAQYAQEEVAAQATLVGPHRDNFVIAKSQITSANRRINDQTKAKEEILDLSKYGSRGEQRLAVFWLKLAELAFIQAKSGERPLLLLDDIFSELDESHRDLVFASIGKQQTIITSADPHVLPKKYFRDIKMIDLGIDKE